MTEKALLSDCGPCWVDREYRPDENIPEIKAFMSAMDAAAAKAGSSEAKREAITEAYVEFVGGLGKRARDHRLIISLQLVHRARFDALQSIERLVADNIEAAKVFPSAGFKKTLVQALVSTKPTTLAAKIALADMVFEEFQGQLAGPANGSVLPDMKNELSKWKVKWTAEVTAREKVLEFQARVRKLMTKTSTKKSLNLLEGCSRKETIEISARLEGDAARNVHKTMKARLTESEASGPIGAALDEELASALMKLGNPTPQLQWLAQFLSDP